MSEEDFKKEAECEKEEIEHVFGRIYKPWFKPWKLFYQLNLAKEDKGAIPMTVRRW
jgi:hypothetical protein